MMLQWRLCIKAIFLFFLKVLLIWKEDGMRCGEKDRITIFYWMYNII